MCFAPQRRPLFQPLNFQKCAECGVFCTFWLGNVFRATAAYTFDIWMWKSGASPSVFYTFDLEMCFAPQRRALFQHFNFQKWSECGVFCTVLLGNVLRATTACTFSTSQLLKVLRSGGVLYILTWKCASRHNGVHFFDIATSKSVPKRRCFVHFDFEMCFAPQQRAIFHLSSGQLAPHPPLWRAYFSTTQRHKSLAKHSESRLSYLFAHLHLLSFRSFSSLLFSLLGFSSLTLPTSAFPSVHIVGSLTSKLPSMIITLAMMTIGNDPDNSHNNDRNHHRHKHNHDHGIATATTTANEDHNHDHIIIIIILIIIIMLVTM